MNVKISAAVAVAGVLFAFQARAQPVPELAPAFYAGPVLGGGFGSSRKNFAEGTTTGTFDVSGVVGGATAGVEWRAGSLMLGLSGTALGSGLNGTTHRPNYIYDYITANHWLVLLDPRLGWEIAPGVVPYATGGLAVGDIQVHTTGNTASRTPGRAGVDYTRTEPGWNAGAGVQISLSPRWTLDAQYLRVGMATTDVPGDLGRPTYTSFEVNLFTGALEYRF